MKWQEYQQAVERLYNEMANTGALRRNVRLPDRETGGLRQVDVWWEVELSGYRVNILVDAKLRQDRVDVREVESVIALGRAVGAHKCVVVAPRGWTEAAVLKADAAGLDLKLLTIEEAFRYLDLSTWRFCILCTNDVVILEQFGVPVAFNDTTVPCAAGRCRECRGACVLCMSCEKEIWLPAGVSASCDCPHGWMNGERGVYIRYRDEAGAWIGLADIPGQSDVS